MHSGILRRLKNESRDSYLSERTRDGLGHQHGLGLVRSMNSSPSRAALCILAALQPEFSAGGPQLGVLNPRLSGPLADRLKRRDQFSSPRPRGCRLNA